MYYLLIAILYPLSLLPLRMLYLLSDAAYAILFYVIGYRKQVVWDNLKHAFPEKSDDELLKIRKQFYHSFCDQWIETIKLLSISEKALNKHISGNWQVLQQLGTEGKDAYVMLGHTFNWEWACVATQWNIEQQFAGVYLPVSSKAFDQLMARIRMRSGAWLVSMKAQRDFQKLKGVRHVVGLIADQNPSNRNGAQWENFMNREAPFFKGPALLAARAHGAIVFAGIKKVKRGCYNVTLTQLTDDAATINAEAIIRSYVSFMEQQLKEQPANWMWTHKRWKHQPPVA